jgi:hypothetical protein
MRRTPFSDISIILEAKIKETAVKDKSRLVFSQKAQLNDLGMTKAPF